MLNKFKLLIVEDDKSVIKTYERTISLFNQRQKLLQEEKQYEFLIDAAENKSEALEKINNKENKYNGAIIDLDLEGRGGEDSSGLDVIRHIKKHERFPVFIISGTTHQLSDEDDITQNDLYKIFVRGDSFDFIKEFINIYSTGITDILNRTGKIEEFINTIYWEHLSTSLKPWIEDNIRSEEDKKQSLIRYCIMHLQEYLDLSTDGNGNFADYYPAEFFITGPIKKSIFTGDIFIYNQKRFVVVTPACDFANGNISKLHCLNISELYEVDDKFNTSPKNEKVQNKLRPYLFNQKPRYHFIPELNYKSQTYNAGILDFQNQVSFDYQEIQNAQVQRVATISQPFLKDLIERRTSYYSRQGAPNMSKDQLNTMHLS